MMTTGGLAVVIQTAKVVLNIVGDEKEEFRTFSLGRIALACIFVLQRCGDECGTTGVNRFEFARGHGVSEIIEGEDTPLRRTLATFAITLQYLLNTTPIAIPGQGSDDLDPGNGRDFVALIPRGTQN